jgi:multidrug transporter EmrE-like cation transporter
MVNVIQLATVILAGISVAIADVIIKKIAIYDSFWMAIRNPWMIVIVALYITQIIFFIYVFNHKWDLGIVGNIQMAFYSLTVVLSGILLFGETISLVQSIGIIFTLVGVLLMNR